MESSHSPRVACTVMVLYTTYCIRIIQFFIWHFFYTSYRRNITFVWDSSYEHCRPFFLSLLLYSHFLLGCSCQGCGDYPGGKSDGLIRLHHSHPIPDYSTLILYQIASLSSFTRLHHSHPIPDCSTLILNQIAPLSSYTRLLHSPPVPDCSTLILYHIAPLSSYTRLLHSHPIPDCTTLILYQIASLSSYTRLHHSYPIPDCSTLILYQIDPLSSHTRLL